MDKLMFFNEIRVVYSILFKIMIIMLGEEDT